MTIDFEPSDLQRSLRDAVTKICVRFDDDYWLQCDRDGKFPHEFHKDLASEGWLGICIPEAYGGSGLGITEAAIMMEAISASGAGFSGASAVHMNIFGLNPVVVYGSEEQRRRMLCRLLSQARRRPVSQLPNRTPVLKQRSCGHVPSFAATAM